MSNSGGVTYTTTSDIPAQPGGTTVFYVIEATDDGSATTTSAEQSYTVLKAEPTNHVTGFTATANSSSQITTSWTDATGATLPDGYLVKAATGGNPTAPVDGTAESDGTLVKNITQGTQQAVFTGLNAETTYNFMIWPYTNSGSDIDYKTDGTIPSASATTEATPVVPDLIISEVTDPSDQADAKYIELFNTGNTVINLNGWSIRRYANGNTSSSDVDLTGHSLAPNQTLTVAYNNTFTTAYGFSADIENGNISGNGDDVYELYDGSVTVDIYGEIGVDGTNQLWEYTNSKAVRNSDVSSPNATWTDSEWTITSNANVVDMTPGEHNNYVSVTATGNWNTASTWSNGTVPTASENVVVPSNVQLTIASAKATGECYDITLEDGATLVGQENLTVNGTATVKKAFTGYTSTTADDGWYVVSSPVNGMTIAGSDFVPGANDDLYEYDEAQNLWLNYDGGTFDDASFAQAKGYLVAYENDVTNGFAAGDFNKTDAISATITETNTRWNLIGNPYPSKVTWADVTKTYISSPKMLNATTGAWEDLGTELEIGQGIFVYAEDASGTPAVTFDLADQTHGAGVKTTVAYANLNAIYGEHAVTVRFATNDKTTQSYEWEHDARYLYPISQIPYFSAVSADDVMVSTYVMSEQPETTTVPLYLAVSEEQDITFTFNGEFAYNVVLEDKANGSMTELSAGNAYSFTALPSDNDDRFVLHLNKSTIGIGENSALEGVKVYANAQNIYIHSDVELTSGIVTVFNTLGQVVLSHDVAKGYETIRMERKGAYIVKVEASEGNITEKVIIQ